MITRGGMSEIIYYNEIKKLRINERIFYSLPQEYQKAIIMAGVGSNIKDEKENYQKKTTLKQNNIEEKVKDKILVLLKKNK